MNNISKHIVDQLVSRAKALAGNRIKNKGRPRTLMSFEESETVSAMRKRGCSINAIFRVMSENGLTEYKSYPKFKAAYTNHKLYA